MELRSSRANGRADRGRTRDRRLRQPRAQLPGTRGAHGARRRSGPRTRAQRRRRPRDPRSHAAAARRAGDPRRGRAGAAGAAGDRAHRARGGRGSGRGAEGGRRRLRGQAVRVRRARGARADPPADGPPDPPDAAPRRSARARPARASRDARRAADPAVEHRVRPAEVLHAQPRSGPLPRADPARRLGLRPRSGDERRRRLRRLSAPQAAPRGSGVGDDLDAPLPRVSARRPAMIRRSSLRWRLVAGFVATMLVVLAVVFVLVYEQTGSQLRAQTNSDVRGDVTQLAEAARALRAGSATELARRLESYIRAQPYSATSSLLFAIVGGRRAISNHPELLSPGIEPDPGETAAEQARESSESRALRSGATGQRTAIVPDLGLTRIDERIIGVSGVRVRLGAGESLGSVSRAQRAVARTFLLAGGVGLALVLVGAYLAGALISRPLRRMARVAAQVDDGDLAPRMTVSPMTSREIRVLAQSFNHMLDRLAAAFANERAFVADASHELRTPLTVIAGQFEVLAAELHPSVEEIRRTERLIAAEISRITRLIDDMLVLTRSEHTDFLRRTPFDLAPFLTDLWATTTAGRERRFVLSAVPDGRLEADPDRVAQALRNLIQNAIAHTAEPEGLVALTVEPLAAGRLRLVVEDDGPGIPEDQRERVFERFHRTDQARDRISGGAGLGLSIVRAIAQAHGGRVRATARQGGGARLELELPGYRPAPRPSAVRVPSSGGVRS